MEEASTCYLNPFMILKYNLIYEETGGRRDGKSFWHMRSSDPFILKIQKNIYRF
jgi:hypothetical protein